MKLKEKSVLIVEDAAIVSAHIKRVVEHLGYEVIAQLTSGEDALEYLQNKQPDIILMDIMLEGQLDGINTVELINEHYGIPIIYLTAFSNANTIHRAKLTNPYGYLIKPINERDLEIALEIALHKHKIELKLREKENMLQSIIDSIGEAIITTDPAWKITLINDEAVNITGWQKDKATGKVLTEVVHLQDVKSMHVLGLQELISISSPSRFMLTNRRGKQVWIGEGSVYPVEEEFTTIGNVLVFKDLTQKIKREEAEEIQKKQRLANLIEGQELERKRIAKELHDGLLQQLNVIKINTEFLLREKPQDDSLLRLKTMLEETVVETRRISENLAPLRLDTLDLPLCIRSLCNEYQTGDVSLVFHETDFPQQLSPSIKMNLYRICQEAISNAIRHAAPSNVYIQLLGMDGFIRLIVEDDGKGSVSLPEFTHYGQHGHNGIQNMMERAEIIGGKLYLDSALQQGTSVTIEIPYSEYAPES